MAEGEAAVCAQGGLGWLKKSRVGVVCSAGGRMPVCGHVSKSSLACLLASVLAMVAGMVDIRT